MSDFSAIYLPALPLGREDPSRSGFATEEEAEAYLFSKMCGDCKKQRQLFVDGVEETGDEEYSERPDSWPACACEWLVLPTDKANGTLSELMDAAGFEVIYTRPTEG